jgi:predicted aspartyl protease
MGIIWGKPMGMFQKNLTVSNIKDSTQNFKANFWIDSGALYTFIPSEYLERIKAEPIGTRNLILADGRTEKMLFGFCNFEIEGLGDQIPCPVIFAPKDSLLLLGATVLENFGVAVDPINKDLKSILSVIGGFIGSK